jgi:2,3-dihydroxybiphenyl 1,2-dioxygenase
MPRTRPEGIDVHHDLQLAYLGIDVPDPASLSGFFRDVIGLVPGEPAGDGAVTWRNDGRAHRVIVQRGPANDAAFVGFETADAEVLAATVERLRVAGFAVTDDAGAQARRVEQIARVDAPWGVPVELVTGLAPASTPYSSPLMPGGFLTEGVGFGHVVFATTAFDESLDFVDALGLVQSDWLEMEIAAGIELEVRFFHCNERHHTLALAKAPFELPQTLHHLMVETNDRDDVGAAFDRAWATDLAIPNGLGRHDNDGMFSFYVQSPAGFQVEVGHGARVITDGWDDNRRYDRISAWGHQPLRQP